MTKKDIIEKVAADAEITKKDAEVAVNSVLEGIENSLIEESKITFIGFGTFEVRTRAARAGRNPKTGAAMQFEESKNVGFKAAKGLKEKLK